MNYTVKSISAGAMFRNAFRIAVVVGFTVSIITFFALPNPNIRFTELWQKVSASVVFTGVYAFVISMVLLTVALLYNLWTAEFKLQPFFMRCLYPSLILSAAMAFSFSFGAVAERGFFLRLLAALAGSAILTPFLSALITGFTAIFNAIGVRTHGVKVQLDQE